MQQGVFTLSSNLSFDNKQAAHSGLNLAKTWKKQKIATLPKVPYFAIFSHMDHFPCAVVEQNVPFLGMLQATNACSTKCHELQFCTRMRMRTASHISHFWIRLSIFKAQIQFFFVTNFLACFSTLCFCLADDLTFIIIPRFRRFPRLGKDILPFLAESSSAISIFLHIGLDRFFEQMSVCCRIFYRIHFKGYLTRHNLPPGFSTVCI